MGRGHVRKPPQRESRSVCAAAARMRMRPVSRLSGKASQNRKPIAVEAITSRSSV